MFKSVEDAQKFGKDNFEITARSFDAMSKALQTLVADVADYGKRSFETQSATVEKLLGAKSLDKAVEINADYARAAYENFVAQTTKFGDLVTDIAKESYRPFEGLLAKSGAPDLVPAKATARPTGKAAGR